MDALDQIIVANGADAYLVYASSAEPDMRYLTGFSTSDPFVFIKRNGERGVIVISQMEYARAVREARTAVMTRTAAGLPDILKKENNLWDATALMIAGLTKGTILVPPNFPIRLARSLERKFQVKIDEKGLANLRAVKSRTERRYIRHVQQCTEKAIDKAITLIRKSQERKGTLFLQGEPLTSERIRGEMHRLLIDLGCRVTDTIVSCGAETAIPHAVGNGPLLANEPIIIDLFPQDERSGYYSDMTRTVVRGEASPEIKDMYSAVSDAHNLAVSLIQDGKTGSSIHQKVIDLFSSRGFESGSRGFIHNLGHGVGLEIHEAPSLGPSGGPLAQGNVITVEPGLYFPKIGGVRLEDIGTVEKRGFRLLTKYPKELVL